MRCENCGKELPEDAAFCAECGARTRPESAAAMALLAATSGLVSSARAESDERAAEVPELPEPAEAAESVPGIPAAAMLPEGAGAEMGTEAMTATDSATDAPEEYIEAARVREEKRRAAQTLLESAQMKLHEELEGLPEPETMIWEQQAVEDGGHVGMGAQKTLASTPPPPSPPPPPPPPPPPSPDERMWAETRERAREDGVGMPVQAPEESPRLRGRGLLEAAREQSGEETGGQNCCAYGCIAFFVLMIILFVVGAIINMGH